MYSGFKLAVLGDYILDVWVEGRVTKVSEEFDEPVILNPELDYSAGGAGNLAVQLVELGAEVHAFGVRGTHDLFPDELLIETLKDAGVMCEHVRLDVGRTMTVKCRISSGKRRFVRVDTETTTPLPDTLVEAMLDPLLDKIHDFDAVLVADYNKGVMTPYAIDRLLGNREDTPVMVDPKYKNFSKYVGVTILKPNLREWVAAGRPAMQPWECEHLVVTKGQQGMDIMFGDPNVLTHIPARKVQVSDITGAGDVVMAVLCLEWLRTEDILAAATLANYAGSVVVQKPRTAHVGLEELRYFATREACLA